MLRGLTERPNVQSTLILSRRNGSIIRATGIGLPEQRSTSASDKPYEWSQARESNSVVEGSEGGLVPAIEKADNGDTEQVASPVEILAASIFQFVNSANALGETLGTASRSRARTDGSYAASGYGDAKGGSKKERNSEEDAENAPSEDEVQLLRMRTKYQEMVIFPDSNYICCVVQRVGKAVTTQERR